MYIDLSNFINVTQNNEPEKIFWPVGSNTDSGAKSEFFCSNLILLVTFMQCVRWVAVHFCTYFKKY